MSDPNNNMRTHTETHTERTRSGGAMAFIVGGLVVAVLVIAWFIYGGDIDTAGSGAVGDGETNISIEAPEGGNASAGATAGADAPEPDAGAGANAEAEATTAN